MIGSVSVDTGEWMKKTQTLCNMDQGQDDDDDDNTKEVNF